MGSLHGHIPFYLVLVLVLSSNHILAEAHKDFKSESKAQADFKSLIKLAQKKTLHTSSTESVLESEGAVDFKNAIDLVKKSMAALIETFRKVKEHVFKINFLDRNIQKNLKSYSEFYKSTTVKIKDSLPALDSKRYGDATTWVGAAADWAETYRNIQKNLKSYSEFYKSTTAKIKDSLPALDSKRYGDATTWIGAAADWAETCENIFAGKSPLTSMKTEFKKLVSVALAVIKKVSRKLTSSVSCTQIYNHFHGA
ncbi:hypothetical protein OIU84_006792 [Salix udensis]|uniref:Pectinesterase inhibitor domain-containing protein n=1 Tax=Salix udensis TaxID=889485 RepID=A0AAD6K1G9_9ROSI|nr:hypothetical protein OIU84_006792 [Salix udensis]